ncbi:acyl-CoA dehydrogenase family protein [Sphingobium sp.]|uniref:acyl-CoA dehydrogenase family protein n=1 Tax=Sphingobium sp. TaxID=1912891 RepID=UPI0028BD6753|nr:acyl-CoA dehydrogenase family protein [Sphingobium sp.]
MLYADFHLDDFNALSDADFRALANRFLHQHHPPELRSPAKRLHWDEVKPWYMILSAAGWLAPAWPREHGGMGLSAAKQLIYMDVFERFGAARSPDHGIVLLGPLLITYGSPDQRARFLPRIITGEEIWCQGYSEPNAGSDLASLRTEAVLDGEHWVVNGQKIWTTLAGDANWMFALVRTDKTAKQQQGISFLLIPMDTPGVTVRPIINLDLQDEFSEVFFDDVRVPQENLVGEVNQGWTMAKNLLGFERIFLGSPRMAANALARLIRLGAHAGLTDDPLFVDRLTRFRLDLADHECLFETIADRLRRGQTLGPEVSYLKLNQTQLFQRITEYMLEIAGAQGGLLHPIDGDRALNPMGQFLVSRAATIYGGASEVQRNILAKTILG